MRDLAERIAPRKPLATWLYWAQYSIALFVLGFPLAVYEGFVREHKYGLSNQTLAAWLIDGCTNSRPDPADRTPERDFRYQRLPGRRFAAEQTHQRQRQRFSGDGAHYTKR